MLDLNLTLTVSKVNDFVVRTFETDLFVQGLKGFVFNLIKYQQQLLIILSKLNIWV